jgi:hypothetical protein
MGPDRPNDTAGLSRARVVSARLLTILGLILVLVSLVAVYVRYELLDDGTFRGTSTQLLESDEIRSQLAATAVETLYANVDVAAAINARLPPSQRGLAIPIAAAFHALAERIATQLLATPAVQQRLVDSLGLARRQVVRLLEDRGRFTRVEGGVVYLDVRQLVTDLATRLGLPASVAERVPASASRIELIRSNELATAQRGVRLLNILGRWLWVFVFVSWAIALYLVPGRRRQELRAIAIGFVLVGVLVLVFRRVAGMYAVDQLATTVAVEPATEDAYAIVTRHLQDAGRTDVAVGVVTLIGVWLASPRERARVALRWLAPYLARPVLTYGVYALIWLILLVWGPTVQFRRPLYIVLMLVLSAAGLELLRRLARRRYPNVEPTSIGLSLEEWWASFSRSRETVPPETERAVEPSTEATQLESLAALHEAGKLTDDEFSKAKQRVLA